MARALERIGDNAVDIAELTIFVVSGLFRELADVSHPNPEGSESTPPCNAVAFQPALACAFTLACHRLSMGADVPLGRQRHVGERLGVACARARRESPGQGIVPACATEEQVCAMNGKLALLAYDPLPPILASRNPALQYLARRDLLDEDVGSPEPLWRLAMVEKILRRQQDDGAWRCPGGTKQQTRRPEDCRQLETYRILGVLVEKYGANRSHPAVRKAAQFLFSCQSREGDFRGIYGAQYSPNHSAAIMELLIKAGYAADRRIAKGFGWLLSIRQNDGGWAIPWVTVGAQWRLATLAGPCLQPDRSRPFSHLVTGVVLRAFAADSGLRDSEEAKVAGSLLASRLFRSDPYMGGNTAKLWTKFRYPFWSTDLLSALDSLSLLGFGRTDAQIRSGLDWFRERQQMDGTWQLTLLRAGADKETARWVSLAICRVFKRMS